MSRGITRKTIFFALLVAFALVAAFGATTASFAKASAHKKVTITVCYPPGWETDPVNRAIFMRDVSDFENRHPNIVVVIATPGLPNFGDPPPIFEC
jgi:ABC-type glycerol-3-phosphate transport system substrate-binding protein